MASQGEDSVGSEGSGDGEGNKGSDGSDGSEEWTANAAKNGRRTQR